MATFQELITRTAKLIRDSSAETLVEELLNQGVSEIAGGMSATLVDEIATGRKSDLVDVITPPLPDLLTIDTVATATDAAYVDMPEEFHRDLYLVASETGSEIDIANSFIEFTSTYPLLDKSGIVSEVIEHGNKLYYQGIPTTSVDLTLYFYRKPVDMSETTDTPDGIPEHLQISLLTNYAAWKFYEIIESSTTGENPNTQKYMKLFFIAMRTLALSIPYDTRGLFLR